jgi:hypothetical protein
MSKKYSLKKLEELDKKQEKTERWIGLSLLLASGIGGNLFNWYLAHTKGLYSGLLAAFSPALILIAIYSVLFPSEFSVRNIRMLSFRMWVAIVFAILLCFANLLAFEYGLY